MNGRVFAFNINDLNDIRAIVECANEAKVRIIMNVSKKTVDFIGKKYLAAMINEAKRQCEYLQVQLDHAKSLDYIEEMISMRIFDIIMADGSSLSLDDNILFTKQAGNICSKYGCQIEGEIGVLPDVYQEHSRIQYTDIEQAKLYCKKVKVDFLAVSVGNAHGYNPKGKLNYELIAKIHKSVEKPLVLHGADFLGIDSLRQALNFGIFKVNIGPELRKVYYESVSKYPYGDDCECDIRKPMQQAIIDMKQTIYNFLKI